MIVLVGAVGGELCTNFIGHVGPDFTDSGGERPSDGRHYKRLFEQLPGVLLGRDTLRPCLGGKDRLPLVG